MYQGIRFRSRALAALAAVLVVATAAAESSALAQSPRLGFGRKTQLAGGEHFGEYYSPLVLPVQDKVYAVWRNKRQTGTDRLVAASTDGGRTFGKPRKVRVPGLSAFVDVAVDPTTGSVYFAGRTVFPEKIGVVRADADLKVFGALTYVDTRVSLGDISLSVDSTGKVFVAWQTPLNVRFGGADVSSDRTSWVVSTDGGATFGDPKTTTSLATQEADKLPTLASGPDGSTWLAFVRESPADRAAAGSLYAGGRVFVKRIDGETPGEAIELGRMPGAQSAPDGVNLIVVPDGSLRVSWQERWVDVPRPKQSVFFARVTPGLPVEPQTAPLAEIGLPRDHRLTRTDAGMIVVVMHGAGFDSRAEEPSIVARGSSDDGLTWGPFAQITTFPPETSFDAVSDGERVFGMWTDTRLVTFGTFKTKK